MPARQPVTGRILLGSFTYRWFVTIVRLLLTRVKPRRALEAQVIALRHQVAVLHAPCHDPTWGYRRVHGYSLGSREHT